MLEIHGIADARKGGVNMFQTTDVLVEDGNGEVVLRLGTNPHYPALLTPEQARRIASLLWAAAKRVDPALKLKQALKPAPKSKAKDGGAR